MGPMHEEKNLGNTPKIPLADSTVLTVFETLKNIDFQGGIPTFKNETKTRQWVLLFFLPIGPMG